MKLSVIIPCYNEEGNVKLMHEKLSSALKDIKYELIFINDGSKDNTYNKLKEEYEKDKTHIKVINFSRNFGKDAAIYAGLSNSKGKYSVIIDGDLQQNPNYLLKMIEFLDNNPEYDQVAMVNKKRPNESLLAKILKSTFYKFINRLSEIKFENGASDFRMLRKEMVKSIISLSENNRFSKGIFAWVGYNTKYLPYEVEDRHSGKTKFNLIKSFKYAINGIINFSVKPLKISTITGFLFSSISFVYLIYILISTIVTGNPVPGYPSLICLILFLGGLNLLAIGIVGEYIAKMYLEVKDRPIYIAKNTLGFEDEIL